MSYIELLCSILVTNDNVNKFDRKLARFRFLRSFNMSGNGLMLLLFNYLFPQTRYNVINVCMFLDLQDHLRFDRGVGTSYMLSATKVMMSLCK